MASGNPGLLRMFGDAGQKVKKRLGD